MTALNDMILLPSELHGAVTDSDFTGLSVRDIIKYTHIHSPLVFPWVSVNIVIIKCIHVHSPLIYLIVITLFVITLKTSYTFRARCSLTLLATVCGEAT